MRLLALALALALVGVCVMACDGGHSGNGSSPDSGVADAGQGLPPGPGLAGYLRLEDGGMLPDEQVLACMETTCLFGDTDQDGFFHFEIEPDADVALKTSPAPLSTPRLGAALCPIDIRDPALVYAETLYVPLLPEGEDLGPSEEDPQTLMAGDGVILTLNRSDLTPRVGDTLVDVAAREVPPERRCPQLLIPGEEIVGVYALHPFGATSSSPIAVTVPSGLPAGTSVYFRSIDEIQGDLSEPAVGEADGEVARTEPGQGLFELSWLVVSR